MLVLTILGKIYRPLLIGSWYQKYAKSYSLSHANEFVRGKYCRAFRTMSAYVAVRFTVSVSAKIPAHFAVAEGAPKHMQLTFGTLS